MDIKRRRREHLNGAGKKASKFSNALGKYGPEAFDFEILEYCDEGRLIEREQHYLDTLQPFGDNGYNLCPVAGSSLGVKQSESHKQKQRARRHTEESRRKMSESSKGEHTLESRRKRSIAMQGKNKGREHSTEVRAKQNKYTYTIEGVVYVSMKDITNKYGCDRTTVRNRCNSVNFPDWSMVTK